MIRHSIGTLVAFTVVVLAGCGAGRDFVRPTSETLMLGQTTYAEVIQKFGEPRRTGEVLTNGKQIKSISYAFATQFEQPNESGVTPARAIVYYFLDDTLVGHEFVSSFKKDNSDFDHTKIGSIAKGKTTRADVIQLLGKPTGTYIAPMVKTTSGEAFGYAYSTFRRRPFSVQVFRKVLRISFDEKDLVSDIDFSTSGNK